MSCWASRLCRAAAAPRRSPPVRQRQFFRRSGRAGRLRARYPGCDKQRGARPRRPRWSLSWEELGHRPPAGVEPPRARRGERTPRGLLPQIRRRALDRPKPPDVAIEPRDRLQRPTVSGRALASELRRGVVRSRQERTLAWPPIPRFAPLLLAASRPRMAGCTSRFSLLGRWDFSVECWPRMPISCSTR